MKILLPWKKKGFDGEWYWAKLTIDYSTTQTDELMECAKKSNEENRLKDIELKEKELQKNIKSGLRKCPGHKSDKFAKYDVNGKCSICQGYKK
jgi:hypothetical protein